MGKISSKDSEENAPKRKKKKKLSKGVKKAIYISSQ